MSKWLIAVALILSLIGVVPVQAEEMIFDAKERDDKRLTIYSSTDIERMTALIDAFQSAYPRVAIDYHLLETVDVYTRAVSEMDAGGDTADLMLSSAMDLQIKLVNDGYARAHSSAETEALPSWANWRNEAFGFTYEPAVIVYNRRLAPELASVTSRFDLAQEFNAQRNRFRGKVVTYDPERSGLGFLFGTQDAIKSEDFWYLARNLGDAEVEQEASTATMIDKVASGEALVAYNVLGSYAHARQRRNDHIAITIPSDYCLVMSRIAVISRSAREPEVAGAFIDFLISRSGQQIIAGPSSLYALRGDIQGGASATSLREEASGPLIPIHLGPGLLVYLDKLKRRDFLDRWHRATRRYPFP